MEATMEGSFVLVSIASGKGGTGKTTLALLLAAAHNNAALVDCDVEEPNCHLFLKAVWQSTGHAVSIMIPRINTDDCTACGRCAKACRFNAIAIAGGKALLFDELCHSCEGCVLACRSKAIVRDIKPVGTMIHGFSRSFPGTLFLYGVLQVGVPSAVPLIKALKNEAGQISGDVILDCPPGTSCSMVQAVKDTDFCILVTEPNPLGMHDLELAMNVARFLNVPCGVVINKSDGGVEDEEIEQLCRKNGVPLMAKIPHSQSFAQQYAGGRISDEFSESARHIWCQLTQKKGGMT